MSRYEPYGEYKYTSAEWLDEIPNNWNIVSLKLLIDVRDGTHDTPSYVERKPNTYPLVTSKDVTSGSLKFESCKYISSEDYSSIIKRSKVDLGDILMPMIGTVGSPIVVDQRSDFAIKNLALFKTAKNTKVNTSFLNYFLLSKECENQFSLEARGGVQSFVSLGVLRGLGFPNAPLPEQKTIAAFLDYETGKIDQLIKKQQDLIALLEEKRQAVISHAVTKGLNPHVPMKNSGVEWLGEVPVHWEVSRVKYQCLVKGRIGFRGYTVEDLVDKEDGALVLGASEMNSKGEVVLTKPQYISWVKYFESPEIMLEEGMVLVVQRGSTVGKTAFVPAGLGDATINPSLIVLRDLKLNSMFLTYSLLSSAIKSLVDMNNSSTAIPMISQEQVGNYWQPVPPIEEQNYIAQYIFEKLLKIDDLINKAKTAIELMQERRTALISAAVTGKIDVRQWKAK